MISGGWIVASYLLPALLCPPPIRPMSQMKSSSQYAFANGKVVDVRRLINARHQSIIPEFTGSDFSNSFPLFTALGRTAETNSFPYPEITRCVGPRQNQSDRWLSARLQTPGFKAEGGRLVNCPLPDGTAGPCFTSLADIADLRKSFVAGRF